MKVAISSDKFEYLTENSLECDSRCAFVQTSLNTRYLKDALSRGAPAILKPAQISHLFGLDRIKIVGITGTNGKTTTASAIYSMLLDLGYKAALQGTRGFFINDEQLETHTLTTPTLLNTYRHIYQAVRAECDFFIMEVSSHAIAQNRCEGIEFAIKALTNITQDHLDYHGDIETYREVKNSFFSDSSAKIINKDESHAKFNIANTYTYAVDESASYRASAYSLSGGIDAVVQHFEQTCTLSSDLYGLFNLYNLLCAIATVHQLTQQDLNLVCRAVEGFGGVSGRMEIVSSDPLVIVDFAHTPDGIKEVLNTLRDKDIVVVFGAGGDRDRSKRASMGRVASRLASKIYITSDNPRFEDPSSIVADILEGIEHRDNVVIELDRKKAIEMAIENREENEAVLILGKGDEEYQIIYDTKFEFDDRAIAREIIAKGDAS